MTREQICSIIAIILVIVIVVWNIRKMKKTAEMMKNQYGCGGSCAGCSQKDSCSSLKKENKE